MTRRDKFWLWLARLALRHMSNRAAWWLFSVMRDYYTADPQRARGHD